MSWQFIGFTVLSCLKPECFALGRFWKWNHRIDFTEVQLGTFPLGPVQGAQSSHSIVSSGAISQPTSKAAAKQGWVGGFLGRRGSWNEFCFFQMGDGHPSFLLFFVGNVMRSRYKPMVFWASRLTTNPAGVVWGWVKANDFLRDDSGVGRSMSRCQLY